ncbi:MAG: ABC transporter permease [Planctomycetaceae bacterium]
MNVFKLVVQEIRHRKWNFILGLMSVSVAVACLVGSLTLLDAHEIVTTDLLAGIRAEHERDLEKKRKDVETAVAQREKEVAQAGKKLQDEMRKITKEMGFNVLILPEDQDINELRTSGTVSATMPEDYVNKLANSKIMTVRHLLPILSHTMEWDGPQKKMPVVILGTRGEVPLAHRDPKKPLHGGASVPKGTAVLGYEVHQQQKLKVGDTIKLLGKTLKVTKTYPQRQNTDDYTIYINLAEAQEALNKQNLVNVILALECNCASADRLGEIRRDIAKVLPGTQVIENDGQKALARAEARNKAKKAAQEALKQEKKAGAEAIAREKESAKKDLERANEQRESLKKQRQAFAIVLVPLSVIGAALWIGFLAYNNVRQRAAEIGILRAIGLRTRHIFTIFLAKAVLIGLLGSLIGFAIGFGLGVFGSELPTTSETGVELFAPGLLILAITISPIFSALASWLPAMMAARQDPAVVLQGE